MKTRIVIVEDNFNKYFATKQLLTAQLKIDVQALELTHGHELQEAAQSLNPDVLIFRPEGGVIEVLERLKKRQANRRNAEIVILLTQDLDESELLHFQEMFGVGYARAA